MNPSNRRIAKQKLPASIVDEEFFDDDDEFEGGEIPPPEQVPRPSPTPRWFQIVRTAFGFTLIVALSIACAWAAKRHITSSPRFALREIELNGAKHLTVEQVEKTADIAVGMNIFTLDLEEARRKLAENPWVEKVTLTRRLPKTILIDVREREASAIVMLNDALLATRHGELFKKLEPGDPSDLPVITGLDSDTMSDDRDVFEKMIRRGIDLSADYDQSALNPKAPLQEIHFARDGAVSMIVGKPPVSLSLGDPPFRRKLEQAARVLSEVEKRGGRAESIIVDNLARPERVVVRLK